MTDREEVYETSDNRRTAGAKTIEPVQRVNKGCQRGVTPPVVRPGYLRKADAAKYLSVSIRTLTEWMQHRVVPYIKLSHRVCLFKQTDLDSAMARFRTAAIGE